MSPQIQGGKVDATSLWEELQSVCMEGNNYDHFGDLSTTFGVTLSTYQAFEIEKLSIGMSVAKMLLNRRSLKHGCLSPRVFLGLMKQSFDCNLELFPSSQEASPHHPPMYPGAG